MGAAKSKRGAIEIAIGAVLVVAGFLITALTFKSASASGGQLAIAYGPVLLGFVAIAHGAVQRSPPSDGTKRHDTRRWVYGGLALAIAAVQIYCVREVMPNRLPSAAMHLWTFPLLMLAMAIATLSGHRYGWWVAVLAGGALMLSLMLVIVRILISAAFLAGVYGAFGKAAATFSFVAIALMIEVVALVPLFHIKWLMTRRGKRAYGV